jgi:hypothetical protein
MSGTVRWRRFGNERPEFGKNVLVVQSRRFLLDTYLFESNRYGYAPMLEWEQRDTEPYPPPLRASEDDYWTYKSEFLDTVPQ